MASNSTNSSSISSTPGYQPSNAELTPSSGRPSFGSDTVRTNALDHRLSGFVSDGAQCRSSSASAATVTNQPAADPTNTTSEPPITVHNHNNVNVSVNNPSTGGEGVPLAAAREENGRLRSELDHERQGRTQDRITGSAILAFFLSFFFLAANRRSVTHVCVTRIEEDEDEDEDE
ncbi:uncharacterized protein PG998_012846 [Apiospora kogelbergensis]|uniref:uncharacterized protein n=1 Tax=Apiospora kogelbergensis TaxID=1337665 RepID=UPI0031319CC9